MLALELFFYLTGTCWGCFCPWTRNSSTGKCGSLGSELENTEQTWAQPSPDGFSGPARGAAGSPPHQKPQKHENIPSVQLLLTGFSLVCRLLVELINEQHLPPHAAFGDALQADPSVLLQRERSE